MSDPQPPKETNFRPILESVARTKGSLVSVFSDFACMCACAFAMQAREEEYLEIAGCYNREELNRFSKAMGYMVMEMESKAFTDILGVYYCEVQSKFTRDAHGEFYTPQEVGKLMAKISVNTEAVIETGKPISVNDPASGSGGLVLSVAEEFAKAGAVDLIRATCQDISKTACDMAYINMTLWGIPARIIWGDTLRGSINGQWENVHWHQVGEPLRERFNCFMKMLNAKTMPKEVKSKSEGERDVRFHTNDVGQQEWIFD